MEESLLPEYEIYTDGSHKNGKAAWAFVVISQPEDIKIFEDSGLVTDTAAVAQMWNVAGEIEAAMRAIKWCIDNCKEVTLISDYQGIQGWANDWATNNQWSEAYARYAKQNSNLISEFVYVKGHSKNKWNDYVDKLAFQHLS